MNREVHVRFCEEQGVRIPLLTRLWKLKEMEYVEKIADKISNISVSGNGVLIEQLKQIFVPQK
jgi:hypothetical protein